MITLFCNMIYFMILVICKKLLYRLLALIFRRWLEKEILGTILFTII